ncbi:Methyltransferase domain-containing protein [Roseovarius litoreus]|uniref:Methyltransferase domain-containing protein n=1 Tax=Roseovarius litoreus TaxID=1155722 RepID=A0A1M7B9Y2_9RHOB|nr:class I SAM-dependent methyltransferase [Roseovarius litoreus]SHL51449.1 Methyltransferase domain-containing protein [Roseovarius litoreus]
MRFKDRLDAAFKAFSDPKCVVSYDSLGDLIDARITTALQNQRLEAEQSLVLAQTEGAQLAADIARDGTAWKSAPPRWDRVREMTRAALTQAGLAGGRMLEIGGRHNPRNADFPEFEYQALDLEGAPGAKIDVMAGDITQCPHIPDASYDFIFSFDVFEHIDKPWLAASEITRLLRPGGVTVHSTLFSWRYHPCPIDYWRYTAEGLKSLFGDLDCLCSEFDATERRRDIRGQGGNAVTPDAFGGWRENIRVNYAGQKPA